MSVIDLIASNPNFGVAFHWNYQLGNNEKESLIEYLNDKYGRNMWYFCCSETGLTLMFPTETESDSTDEYTYEDIRLTQINRIQERFRSVGARAPSLTQEITATLVENLSETMVENMTENIVENMVEQNMVEVITNDVSNPMPVNATLTPINSECPICLDAIEENNTILRCGHQYHNSCVSRWIISCQRHHRVPTCASCRKEITLTNMHRV